MAINTKKPKKLTADEILAFEESDKFRRKVKHFEYQNEDGSGETDQFFVVPPSRETLNAIAAIAQKGDVGKVNELMINSCTLAGDLEKLEWDDALYFALIKDLAEMGEVKKRK